MEVGIMLEEIVEERQEDYVGSVAGEKVAKYPVDPQLDSGNL